MLVYVFRGAGRVFACTTDEAGVNLPAGRGPWAVFKSVEVNRGKPTPGLDADLCFDDIQKYGLHVTDEHVRITENFVGPIASDGDNEG